MSWLLGGSGSGKSSLIRSIAGLIPDFYGGAYEGDVTIGQRSITDMSRKDMVQKVGMVFQDPESQLVMTNAEEEIAFGLENLGASNSLMKRRIMEVTSALSLSGYRQKFIPELSGGQKQKVALASVLAMHPEILLLDEPTSQLDPIAGEEILTMIRRLNEENGLTIVLTEQKLERCFHFADRIIVMDEGMIIMDSEDVSEIARWAVAHDKPFIPPLSQVFAKVGHPKIPVTVKEGREILRSDFGYGIHDEPILRGRKKPDVISESAMIEMKKLWFTYPNGHEVLNNISLKIEKGSFTVVMGENGCGKTTLLKHINGLLRPGKGSIHIQGKDIHHLHVEELAKDIGYLSQNPNDYLFLPTVEEEIKYTQQHLGIDDDGWVENLFDRLGIGEFRKMNPRDLSTGERQKVALASVLASNPKIILLDEPTRGLDYQLKENLGEILKGLIREGTTIVMIAMMWSLLRNMPIVSS